MSLKSAQQYISLAQAADLCEYSQEYLSLRARQGKLRAIKMGRNWVTKEEWLNAYVKDNNGKEADLKTKIANAIKKPNQVVSPSQNDFISLEEASQSCVYSQEYLSLRARQGKLRAIKMGRNWVTKQEWVKEYLATIGQSAHSHHTHSVHPTDGLQPSKVVNQPIVEKIEKAKQKQERLGQNEEKFFDDKRSSSPVFSFNSIFNYQLLGKALVAGFLIFALSFSVFAVSKHYSQNDLQLLSNNIVKIGQDFISKIFDGASLRGKASLIKDSIISQSSIKGVAVALEDNVVKPFSHLITNLNDVIANFSISSAKNFLSFYPKGQAFLTDKVDYLSQHLWAGRIAFENMMKAPKLSFDLRNKVQFSSLLSFGQRISAYSFLDRFALFYQGLKSLPNTFSFYVSRDLNNLFGLFRGISNNLEGGVLNRMISILDRIDKFSQSKIDNLALLSISSFNSIANKAEQFVESLGFRNISKAFTYIKKYQINQEQVLGARLNKIYSTSQLLKANLFSSAKNLVSKALVSIKKPFLALADKLGLLKDYLTQLFNKDNKNLTLEEPVVNQPEYTTEDVAPPGQENGIIVVPSTDKDEEFKEKIKNSFSDEVKVLPEDEDSGIIIPVFKEKEGDEYLYLMVPVAGQ